MGCTAIRAALSITHTPTIGSSATPPLCEFSRQTQQTHGAFTQCWFNVDSASSTLGQHWNTIGWMLRVCSGVFCGWGAIAHAPAIECSGIPAALATWYIQPADAEATLIPAPQEDPSSSSEPNPHPRTSRYSIPGPPATRTRPHAERGQDKPAQFLIWPRSFTNLSD